MSHTYWIQNSDFSSPEGMGEKEPVRSAAHIISVLSEYDWASQNDYQVKQEALGEDCCPAGMGIVSEDDNILHLCPHAESATCEIHLHHEKPGKFLGFIKVMKNELSSFQNVPTNKIEPVIKAFMQKDFEAVLKSLEGYENE